MLVTKVYYQLFIFIFTIVVMTIAINLFERHWALSVEGDGFNILLANQKKF
jgi:hypothetical protein